MTFDTFSQSLLRYPGLGFSLDFSRMDIPADYSATMSSQIEKALADLKKLEAGEIANPDEGRMVGHYWLRNADLAPNEEIRAQITEPLKAVTEFARKVHSGEVAPPAGGRFENIIIIGIGGSALGPQLIEQALGGPLAAVKTYFFDNTDPAGKRRYPRPLSKERFCSNGSNVWL